MPAQSGMKLIVFTKHLTGMNVPQLIEAVKSIGVEGADLCVRPGYPVEPENALKALPAAAKSFRDAGLSISMITTPGDFLDPADPVTEKVFDACAQSGVKFIKLGYWTFAGKGYWKLVEDIRRALEGFSKLAGKYRVKACIHNHSGKTMGLNSCAVMNLVRGFDPQHIGVFADPAHLSLVGEPLDMALDIVGEYLSLVAAKDVIRERTLKDKNRQWHLRVVPLGEGFVDWPLLAKLLLGMKYSGPVSIHAEYDGFEADDVVDLARMDARFFRRRIAEAAGHV